METKLSFSEVYIQEHIKIASRLNTREIDNMVSRLAKLKKTGGRLFILGVGGSAGNASHACNDFRKLCGIEAYAPTDNVSELTARTNDDGWDTVFVEWLKTSRIVGADSLLIFSVGGGNKEKNVSVGLIHAVDLAVDVGADILGVLGRSDGYVAEKGDAVVLVPTVETSRVTPHSEGYQAIIWHCLVSHPLLQEKATKW